jgi:hypothetical protein
MRTLAEAILLANGAAATNASAAIVCNEEGDCWHMKGKVE